MEKHENDKNKYCFKYCVLLHATACNNERTQSVASPESVRLNNKGFEFWNEYRFNDGDASFLDSAIFYFDKAIAEDENNIAARWNKNAVLYEQKKYDEIIAIMNELIEKTDSNDYQTKAMLYKSLAYPYYLKGDSFMFQITLLTAKQYYQLGLKEPLNESFIDDYILFTAYTEGKDAALLELEKYKNLLREFLQYEDFKEYLSSNEFDYRDFVTE